MRKGNKAYHSGCFIVNLYALPLDFASNTKLVYLN